MTEHEKHLKITNLEKDKKILELEKEINLLKTPQPMSQPSKHSNNKQSTEPPNLNDYFTISRKAAYYLDNLENQRQKLNPIIISFCVIFFFVTIPWFFLIANYLSVKNFNNNIELQINKYLQNHNISIEEYKKLKKFNKLINLESKSNSNIEDNLKTNFENSFTLKNVYGLNLTFKEYQARKVEYQKKYGD